MTEGMPPAPSEPPLQIPIPPSLLFKLQEARVAQQHFNALVVSRITVLWGTSTPRDPEFCGCYRDLGSVDLQQMMPLSETIAWVCFLKSR